MLIQRHTIETTVTSGQIWKVWQDIENWKSWDDEIEFSQIDGPFEAGTCGLLKMLNSPVLKTQITALDPMKSYVFEAKLFLARSVSTSSIDQIAGKTYVTFKNEIVGPMALFYALFIGRRIREKTPREMREMLKKASEN